MGKKDKSSVGMWSFEGYSKRDITINAIWLLGFTIYLYFQRKFWLPNHFSISFLFLFLLFLGFISTLFLLHKRVHPLKFEAVYYSTIFGGLVAGIFVEAFSRESSFLYAEWLAIITLFVLYAIFMLVKFVNKFGGDE